VLQFVDREVAGGREVSADPLYFASGRVGAASAGGGVQTGGAGGRIGIIDGGVSAGTSGLARQQGFAAGAPRPNDHAVAIAIACVQEDVARVWNSLAEQNFVHDDLPDLFASDVVWLMVPRMMFCIWLETTSAVAESLAMAIETPARSR